MEGIERIRILGSEITHKMTRKIVDYLLTREDMNDKYLCEEKSLKQMLEFIVKEAEKMAENVPGGKGAYLEDEEVYSLAIHYFDETNENLGLEAKKQNQVEHVAEDEEDLEDIEIEEKSTKEPKSTKQFNQIRPKNVPEGQLSIFDI